MGEGGMVASLLSVEEQEVHDDDARVGCCHYHHWDGVTAACGGTNKVGDGETRVSGHRHCMWRDRGDG